MRISDWSSDVCSSDLLAVMGALADLAQRTDGIRQGELFAGDAGDEATAADLATCFQSVVDAQQLTPRWQPAGFAFEQAPADRKSVVSGKSVSVRVDLGGRRTIKKKKSITTKII